MHWHVWQWQQQVTQNWNFYIFLKPKYSWVTVLSLQSSLSICSSYTKFHFIILQENMVLCAQSWRKKTENNLGFPLSFSVIEIPIIFFTNIAWTWTTITNTFAYSWSKEHLFKNYSKTISHWQLFDSNLTATIPGNNSLVKGPAMYTKPIDVSLMWMQPPYPPRCVNREPRLHL